MAHHSRLKQEEESVEDLLASIRELVSPDLWNGEEEGLRSCEAQVQETLSSFVKGVQDRPSPPFQQTLEGFLAEMVKSPLRGILKEGEPVIFSFVEKHIQDHLPALLTQWIDAHLPALVRECVTDYLENLKRKL